MKGKYKYIIASDLDGTLLAEKDTISPENEAAIKELTERGALFVPCSGRTFSEMPKVLLENPYIRYYIGADGAAIWDKETGERIEFCMPRDQVRPVLDLLDSYETHPNVRNNGKCYVDAAKDSEEIYLYHNHSKLYIEFIRAYVNKVEGFSQLIRSFDNIEMICAFFAHEEEKEECERKIKAMGGFNVASSEPGNIEIFHERAGKGNALLALADRLGVPHENTVAVGDSKNDLDMLRKAGLSLAMENASDLAKAEADRVICHYKQHSAKYILNLLSFEKESKHLLFF